MKFIAVLLASVSVALGAEAPVPKESQKRGRMSAQDMAAVDQNFIGFLKGAAQADVTAARQHHHLRLLPANARETAEGEKRNLRRFRHDHQTDGSGTVIVILNPAVLPPWFEPRTVSAPIPAAGLPL